MVLGPAQPECQQLKYRCGSSAGHGTQVQWASQGSPDVGTDWQMRSIWLELLRVVLVCTAGRVGEYRKDQVLKLKLGNECSREEAMPKPPVSCYKESSVESCQADL
eukprot:1373462-Rhodomonas_salina.1